MMINRIKHIILILFCCTSFITFAQHTDGGVWTGVGFSFEPVNNFTFDFNEELRYNVSVADLYQINSNFSLDYKLSKKFKTESNTVILYETAAIPIVLAGVWDIKKD